MRVLGPADRHVANLVDIDTTHVALGGVSDGAGYALSMGLAYGNSFNHLMIFMAGPMVPYREQGKPRIFMVHGVDDSQMPIDKTARLSVPKLKAGDVWDVNGSAPYVFVPASQRPDQAGRVRATGDDSGGVIKPSMRSDHAHVFHVYSADRRGATVKRGLGMTGDGRADSYGKTDVQAIYAPADVVSGPRRLQPTGACVERSRRTSRRTGRTGRAQPCAPSRDRQAGRPREEHAATESH